MKLEYKLGKIHCAGCASALEELISQVEGVNNCSLNFITNYLIVEVDEKNHKQIEEKVIGVIHKFDKSIEILDPYKEEKENKNKKIINIIKFSSLAISFLILVLLFIVKIPFWASLTLSIFAYLLVGWNVLYIAFTNIIKGKVFDENFLMTIATIGAFILSQFTEAIAVMLFYQVGEILNSIAVKKSEKEIKSISKINSDVAHIVLDNTEMDVSLDKIQVGDIIRVNPGESVPLDGKIIEGETYLNLSILTGESQEVFKSIGEEVLSGSIAINGTILVEVTKEEKDSTVSKIIKLVEQASFNKSKTEKFISKFAKYYTPVVVFLAVCIAFVMPIFWSYSNFTVWIYRALTFLVVSCPCALIISVPLGYFSALGACAKNGIIVKGAEYIDSLSKARSIIFDKTGTLTKGNFAIINIYTNQDKDEDEILEFIAYAENFSNHSIAKSIVSEYKNRTNKEINTNWINGYFEIAGKGIQANIFGIDCLVGNAKLLLDNGITFEAVESEYTVIYLVQNGTIAGYIEIGDEIKDEAIISVKELKDIGFKTVSMFTGDNEKTAKAVAEKINVDCYHAQLLPADKVEKLKEHQDNTNLIFVGDGINDAPILSTCDVGIAMGGIGSNIATESADVIIVDDNLYSIPLAVKISRKTRRIVYENIIFALGVKTIVLALSAVGIGSMWLAIFADVGVSLLAVLNSIRALFIPKKYKK